ncbi:MAG: hypothetical protein WBA74_16485 [Cyclobacteriaceae bacterium]
MKTATKIIRNRIVLIFDYDSTLGPGTTGELFKSLDIDYEPFHTKVNSRIDEEMWQYPLSKAETLREYSQQDGSKLTRQAMEELGKNYPLFDGVETFVKRLRKYSNELDTDVTLEFVMLTAGFGVIPKASVIAESFDRMYAGELIFDEEGRILGAKRIISHVDKVHYIKQLQEGIPFERPSDLENTYLETDPDDHYVPMSQIFYVGDGASDMSAFQAVESGGGIAIAVVPHGDDENWSGYEMMDKKRRVHNVAKARYEDDDELFIALKHAIARNIYEIKLLRLGKGE